VHTFHVPYYLVESDLLLVESDLLDVHLESDMIDGLNIIILYYLGLNSMREGGDDSVLLVSYTAERII
jgi:hypothetical protein